MPPVGFEPTISAGEWPQTYSLDRVATGTGRIKILRSLMCEVYNIVPSTFPHALSKRVLNRARLFGRKRHQAAGSGGGVFDGAFTKL